MGWNIDMPDADWYPMGDERLDGVIREVLDQDVVAIDTETTGLVVWKDMPLFWSLAWGDSRRICMPIDTLGYFRESFADTGKRWVFANAKFDMHMLANVNAFFAGDCIDTQVMHALLYEEESHKLKDMAKNVLGWRWTDFFDTFPRRMVPDMSKAPKQLGSGQLIYPNRREEIHELLKRFERDDLTTLVDYASNDAYGTLRLYEKLRGELAHEKLNTLYPEWLETMEHLFFLTEAPFTKVLWQCERNGIYVNKEYLTDLGTEMQKTLDGLMMEMVQISGNANFNPNSNDQLREHFLNKEGLRPLTMTKGGKSGVKKASIDAKFLEANKGTSPMATALAKYNKLEKLLSTYINNVDDHRDPFGRMHTRFNQDIARTGRLSSSNPNLQNVPTPDKDRFRLRGAFQPQPNTNQTLIVADYAALEMRLLACATVTPENPEGAKEMIQIFLDGKDIHMGSAELVYGDIYQRKHGFKLTYDFLKNAKKIDGQVKEGKLPPEARTEQIMLAVYARNAIKTVSFGLNYGMKEKKLARDLGISEAEALSIMQQYLATYPAIDGFYKAAIAETRQSGFSSTVLGRRRFHPSINSKNTMDRWAEERKAVNNNIQGSAADVVRCAMLKVSAANLEYKYGCKMLLQIHDELMFECPEETADQAMVEIQGLMEHPLPTDLAVPLTISIGKGPSWANAK
jgi:DNA polymerase I-like protein with 3'-5' exonuclease and polymerase domains